MEADRGGRGAAFAVFLLALGSAWGAGNVGGVVTDLGSEFEISLATVGVLSGTLLLGFAVIGTLATPAIAERVGIVRAMALAALLCAAGNVLFAVAPDVALLAGGRAVAGLGLGVAVVVGPVFARATGGLGLVALFGAAIQLGIAGGLGTGAILGDLDVDWRVTFLLSAAVALSPLPFLAGREDVRYEAAGRGGGFVRFAARTPEVWRLGALFVSIFSVPLILGSWLVHYLSVDNGIAPATAGILAFVLFGVSAAAREAGGRLPADRVRPGLVAGGSTFLAALGLVILAVDDSVAFSAVAVLAAGIGFALPYGISLVRAQELWPSEPTEPVALMAIVGTLIPVPLVPLIGSLLDSGDGTGVFLALAAFAAFAGALNLRAPPPHESRRISTG